MTTIGEVLWSDLLNRSDLLATLGSSADFVRSSVYYGRQLIQSPEIEVEKFRFSEFRLTDVPVGSPVKVYLTFTSRRKSGPGAVVDLRIKWPHSWTVFKGRPVVVFHGIRQNQLIRIIPGIISRSGFTKIGLSEANKMLPRRLTSKDIRHPRRLANTLFAAVARGRSLSGSPKWNRRPPFDKTRIARKNPDVVTGTYIQGSEQAGVPWSQTTQTYNVYYRNVSSSTTTPGFGALKRRQLPVNPFAVTIEKFNYGQGLYFRSKKTDSSTYFNSALSSLSIVDNIPALPPFDTATYNRAIKKLIERAEVDINNIAQDLVQYTQTTKMIADSATRIARSVLALKRGDLVTASSALFHGTSRHDKKLGKPSSSKSLANNWLELQYGWKPLLQDIDGSMRALATYVAKAPDIKVVRASAKTEFESVWPIEFRNQAAEAGQPVPNPWPKLAEGKRYWLNSARLMVRYKTDSHLTSFLSQTGFTSPVNLAWELLPFSFVVDWFLPIGPYLESMSAFEGLTFLDGSVTYFARVRDLAQVNFSGTLIRTPSYTSRVRALYDYELILVQRNKLLSFPSQTIPQFKNPISTVHAMNALALLKAAFR